MNVLFVSGEFPPMQGGVGDYTREISLALREQGCQIAVVTSTQAGFVPGVNVHPVVEDWSWNCWDPVLDLVRREQPDIVHIQYQAAAYALHPAINFLPWRLRRLDSGRPRSVVTFHDLKVPYLFPKAGRLRRWVVDELGRRSDAVICTNKEDFEELRPKIDPAPNLIPIGSNIHPQLPEGYERHAWRARWGVGPDDLLLSFFGFINDRKGVDILLHALKRLPSGDPELGEPRLLFIGGQTGASDPTNVTYLGRVQGLIKELDLADRVHWTGYVSGEEVTAAFLAADLCVLPYRDGVSFLHGTFHAALAHGVPILTTAPRVKLPELLHGENVFLVPPQDADALAGAIRHLATDAALCRVLSKGALALAAEFRWDKIAEQTMDVYRRTLGGGQ
jgi:glycosyltransferase involved in cell wall biosynthesis